MTVTANDLYVDFGRNTPTAVAYAQDLFLEFGCFVAGQFFDQELELVRREIGRLIDLAGGGNRPDVRRERFDAGYTALTPDAADAVFSACRRLTSVHSLSVEPRLLELSQRIMNTDMVMSSVYKPVRIDDARREYALLDWHQDYPYAQDSMDAVVHWIPLQTVDEQNGCVMIAPGSHKYGVFPVEMIPSESSGIRGLQLADLGVVDRFPHVRVPMRPGDVLVFSELLLHRSQRNLTADSRWTVQFRHGNFADPTAVAKRWPRGHFERHWLDETHPECIVAAAQAQGVVV